MCCDIRDDGWTAEILDLGRAQVVTCRHCVVLDFLPLELAATEIAPLNFKVWLSSRHGTTVLML